MYCNVQWCIMMKQNEIRTRKVTQHARLVHNTGITERFCHAFSKPSNYITLLHFNESLVLLYARLSCLHITWLNKNNEPIPFNNDKNSVILTRKQVKMYVYLSMSPYKKAISAA